MGRQIINTGGPGPKPRDFLRIVVAISIVAIIAIALFVVYGHH
jgi:hypothetical protein